MSVAFGAVGSVAVLLDGVSDPLAAGAVAEAGAGAEAGSADAGPGAAAGAPSAPPGVAAAIDVDVDAGVAG